MVGKICKACAYLFLKNFIRVIKKIKTRSNDPKFN
jgi:hypothetical protein